MNKAVRDVILELFDDRANVDLWNAYQRELLANEVTERLGEFLTAATPKAPAPSKSVKSKPVMPAPGGNLDNKMFKNSAPIKKKIPKRKKSTPTTDTKQKHEHVSGKMDREEMIKKAQKMRETRLKENDKIKK